MIELEKARLLMQELRSSVDVLGAHAVRTTLHLSDVRAKLEELATRLEKLNAEQHRKTAS